MLNLFIALLGQGMVIPILPDYLKQFNAAGTAAGYLVAAFGAAQFIFSPIGGRLSDQWGRKGMIMSGLFLTVISDLMFAALHTLPLLYLARFIGGIGLGLMVPSVMAYVADITTPVTRAKGMGYINAAMNLGMVLGPGLGGIIAQYGIRTPYYFASGLGLIAAVLSILLPETLSKKDKVQRPATKQQREPIKSKLKKSFQTPYFRYLLLTLISTFGLVNYETVFSLFVEQKYSFDASEISILIMLGAVIGIVVQVWLLDKIIKRFGEIAILWSSLIMIGVAFLLMLIKINFAYLLLVSSIFFIFNAFLRPTVGTSIANLAGEEQGYASGLSATYMSVGTILGPIIAGWLFDKNLNSPYILGAIIVVLTPFLTLWDRKGKKSMKAQVLNHD
jgi:DHA1 family multidrug resistance protein-like MFS transporter